MRFASPTALWFLTLTIPVIALHILRSRRTELVVASTQQWAELDRPVAAARPWQRLRWSLPLVLQLLLVALLALALAGPVWDTGRVSADHLVAIVDTSASMGATDGSPNRLADAIDRVEQLASELGDGATVSIVSAGAPARVVASGVRPSQVGGVLESLTVSEGGFDAEGAGALALGMDEVDRSVVYVLVGDGGLSGPQVAQLPPGTRFEPVGARSRNLGITNVVVRPAAGSMRVLATVTNAGTDDLSATVLVDVDDVTVVSQLVTAPASDSIEVALDVPAGERVAVRLDVDDLLELDDHAFAVGPASRAIRVLRIGGANPFLDALLVGRDDLEVTTIGSLGELDQDGDPWAEVDLAVFDQVQVASAPPVPWIAIAPPGGAPGVNVLGEVDTPVAALVRDDTEVTRGLDLTELAIGTAQRIDAPAATTLVGSEETPLLVTGREDGAAFAYLGVGLTETNLALLPSFPILAERLIVSLAGADLADGSLSVGDPLPLELGVDVVVVSPTGARTEVPAGGLPPELDRTGIWRIERRGADGVGDRLVVVNPSPEQTQLSPVGELAIPGVADDPDRGGAPVTRSFVPWLIAAGMAVLAAEWWVSRRRRGVSRRQWRVAEVMRVALGVALLVALIVPEASRQSSAVGLVVVLDVSDSMNASSEESVERVRDLLAQRPHSAAAGVVLVGANARVDAAVRSDLAWSGPRVNVDSSATDLAAGLRVAGAIAPADRAARIVLVSDGRPTSGGLDAEVQRLRRAGVQLDVIPIDAAVGPDVLVVAVEAPDRSRTTDVVPVVVRLRATVPQQAVVTLFRDGEEVDRRSVDLPAGDSEVRFEQPAGEPGSRQWTATVAGPLNGVTQNDRGRASTRIEGRARVLAVEGAPGSADAIREVIAATGPEVTVVDPESLPALAELASYDVVILVDVPADVLSRRQVAGLVTATRELGVGLVTLGGTKSYGAGGYLGSPLEEILPVISEVKDPKRKSSVAQVFAVDVSGSMGACHCAEDGGGMNSRLPGGVAKSDIARDSALRAIEGLAPTDELGVLAIDDRQRWLRHVEPVGDGQEARRQLSGITHDDQQGNDLSPSLTLSAAQLRESGASLRHIVLFTDGFEDVAILRRLARDAAELRDEGITVSVMGTGEGAASELRGIAESGGGRYYPGRDLRQLPDLLLEETKVVSRQLITEGEFLPEITSNAPVVASLTSAPPVLGYVASTARPTATQHLRVGDERDPLLASWQVGLGRVMSWTSDAGGRWAGGWTSWQGAPAFWSDVIRSVAPEPTGSVQVRFDGAEATVVATFDSATDQAARVDAVVADPTGATVTVPLRRLDDQSFEGRVPVGPAGTYGVGATARSTSGEVLDAVSGTAELGYSREYSSAPTDVELLETASARTGGRGSIETSQAFDPGGLRPGRRNVDLRTWALVLSLLMWPIVVAVSRLRRSAGPDAQIQRSRAGRVGALADTVLSRRDARSEAQPPLAQPQPGQPQPSGAGGPPSPVASPALPAPPTPPASPAPPAPATPAPPASPAGSPKDPSSGSLDELLAAKRRRRDAQGE